MGVSTDFDNCFDYIRGDKLFVPSDHIRHESPTLDSRRTWTMRPFADSLQQQKGGPLFCWIVTDILDAVATSCDLPHPPDRSLGICGTT